jgi:hypothetical protein
MRSWDSPRFFLVSLLEQFQANAAQHPAPTAPLSREGEDYRNTTDDRFVRCAKIPCFEW